MKLAEVEWVGKPAEIFEVAHCIVLGLLWAFGYYYYYQFTKTQTVEHMMVEGEKQEADDCVKHPFPLIHTPDASDSDASDTDSETEYPDISSVELLDQVHKLSSTDSLVKVQAATAIRRHLSRNKNAPIDEYNALGLIQLLLEAINQPKATSLQFECLWSLTNIAAGTSSQTAAVVNNGAVPVLINLMQTGEKKVCEQAVWTLGNIIGDSAYHRDLTLSLGVLQPLLSLITPELDKTHLQAITGVIANLCQKGTSPISMEASKQILTSIHSLVTHEDAKVKVDILYSYCYLAESGEEYVNLVMRSCNLKSIIGYLQPTEQRLSGFTGDMWNSLVMWFSYLFSLTQTTDDGYCVDSCDIQKAALRLVCSMSDSNRHNAELLVSHGVLKALSSLLTAESEEKTVIQVLYILCKVIHNHVVIQQMINEGLLSPVLHHLGKGTSLIVKSEAVFVVEAMINGGSHNQLRLLVQMDTVKCLCELLKSADSQSWCAISRTEYIYYNKPVEVILTILDSLQLVMDRLVDNRELISLQIEGSGGLDTIKILQTHAGIDVHKKSSAIIHKYFCDGDSKLLDVECQQIIKVVIE